ncbi:MAG TPA: hypothetical protein VGG29_03895 [Caulobacteraceae bacterium]|jgi:uncharacterized protein YccT (UPF0319 family)
MSIAGKLTEWSPDHCGCLVLFDAEADDVVAIARRCRHHAQASHHDVAGESRAKNACVQAIAERRGVLPQTVPWSHDADRHAHAYGPGGEHASSPPLAKAEHAQAMGALHTLIRE